MQEKPINDGKQPCWQCKNAVPGNGCGCNWSINGKPVKGWKAEKLEQYSRSKLLNYGHIIITYDIKYCPEFEMDEHTKRYFKKCEKMKKPQIIRPRYYGGNMLQYYRVKKGLRSVDVANLIGMDKEMYSLSERSRIVMSAPKLLKLAEVLGVKASQLAYRQPTKEELEALV